jgi:ribonuclease I
MVPAERSALAEALAECAVYRTFAAGRTLEASAHFSQFETELGHAPAEGVSVHSQLFSGLTLITLVCHQHFAEILPLEIANGVLVRNAARVHLSHKAIQLSSHVYLLPDFPKD